jgi:hypothetical protein
MFSKLGAGDLFATLRAAETPLPVMTSLLEVMVDAGSAPERRRRFQELVRDCVYQDFAYYRSTLTDANASDFLRAVERENSTLRAVSSFCVRRAGTAFERNPCVRAVVTFNLDALLQSYSRAKYGRPRRLRTIERSSAGSRLDKVSIYHMHGYLRFDTGAGDLMSEAPDQLVLTEQDYFNFFNSPTSLFNYTFLHLLREHNGIFVGLSLRDDNLRRLLHYSQLERVRAFEAEGVDENDVSERTLRHVAILRRLPDSPTMAAWEATAGALGVRIEWIHSFDEIPQFFQSVYEQVGGRWSDVF